MEDRRRNEARTEAVAPVKPASRADKIIAEGDHIRVDYRTKFPAADPAMVYGAQIGFLHAQVRKMADECDALNFRRNPHFMYVPVCHPDLVVECIIGGIYTQGEDAKTYGPPEDCSEGYPDELELMECWINGVEVSALLSEAVLEEFEVAALDQVHESIDSGDDWDPQ